MKNCKLLFCPIYHSNFQSWALLILRLIVGIAFFIHGTGKIHTPFNWMPTQMLAVPAVFQFLAAIAEFAGGIALILGILTPLACFGILATMSVATYMHMMIRHDPFVNLSGGMSYEPALVYWGIAILFIAMGPGKYSLDHLIFKSTKSV
jgi:putative oxidoreductase